MLRRRCLQTTGLNLEPALSYQKLPIVSLYYPGGGGGGGWRPSDVTIGHNSAAAALGKVLFRLVFVISQNSPDSSVAWLFGSVVYRGRTTSCLPGFDNLCRGLSASYGVENLQINKFIVNLVLFYVKT